LRFGLDMHGRAVATTQTAERAYKATGIPARMDVRLSVGPGGWLDWLPQETILFDRAALDRRTVIDLAAGAGCLALEAVVLGRAAMGETVRDLRFRDRREIRSSTKPFWIDPLALDASSLAGTATLNAARAFATIVVTDERPLAPLRAALDEPGVVAEASAFAGRTVVRMLAADGWPLRRQIARTLHILREGRPLPRVWQV
jgi:urease accessory protein